MADWISVGDTGLSIRTKLNDLKNSVDSFGIGSSGTSGISISGSSGNIGSSGINGISKSSGLSENGSSGTSGTSGASSGSSGFGDIGKWRSYKALLKKNASDQPIISRVLNQDDPFYLGDIDWVFEEDINYATIRGFDFTTGTTIIMSNTIDDSNNIITTFAYKISESRIEVSNLNVGYIHYIEINVKQ